MRFLQYWREGRGEDSKKFLLVLNGGGWCMSSGGTAAAIAACADRATGALGSSSHWKSEIPADTNGMTNPNCTINPAFCTWSVARPSPNPRLRLGSAYS